MTTISNLISALIIVESSGNDMAIGDGGKAIGPLQIHRGVVIDVNRITGSSYRHQDMTNRAQARAVCEAYLRHYGRGKTTEQQARIWNGGPTGDCKTATVAYWAKVQAQMTKGTSERLRRVDCKEAQGDGQLRLRSLAYHGASVSVAAPDC